MSKIFVLMIPVILVAIVYNLVWQHSCTGDFTVGMQVERIAGKEKGIILACSGNFVTVDFGYSSGSINILKVAVQ